MSEFGKISDKEFAEIEKESRKRLSEGRTARLVQRALDDKDKHYTKVIGQLNKRIEELEAVQPWVRHNQECEGSPCVCGLDEMRALAAAKVKL
jgi:hypothetical protein